jgi:hypothetical protein
MEDKARIMTAIILSDLRKTNTYYTYPVSETVANLPCDPTSKNS